MAALPGTSLAVVQTGVRELEVRRLPLPAIDEDSALLQVEACGICGSDVEQYEGKMPTAPMDVIPGHEPLGRIAAIGDRAAQRWGVDVGDRVAVEPLLSCGDCRSCRGGEYEKCADLTLYSFVPVEVPPGLWGGYAEYLYLDRRSRVHRVDPTLAPELAVMFNPLAAGYRWGVEVPGTSIGDDVLILGCGQRGLACVMACRQAGAETIVVTGLARDAAKLELAIELGADAAIDVDNDDLKSRVRELTGGRGVDVVVDTTPYSTEPIKQAVSVAAAGGRIVLAGIKGPHTLDGFYSDVLIRKELTITGVRGVTSSGYRAAIAAIESGRFPLDRIHTHDFALADADLALRVLAGEVPGEDAIHICLLPD